MTVLARLLGRVFTMLPLLERHLLWELRHLLTLRPERRSDQRVAAPAKTRIAHMAAERREVRRRRGVHHGLVPFVDVKGPILGPHIVLDWFRDHHIPNKSRVRSQSRLLNLVANRAGDAIGRG